jgi:hypothetical protein
MLLKQASTSKNTAGKTQTITAATKEQSASGDYSLQPRLDSDGTWTGKRCAVVQSLIADCFKVTLIWPKIIIQHKETTPILYINKVWECVEHGNNSGH